MPSLAVRVQMGMLVFPRLSFLSPSLIAVVVVSELFLFSWGGDRGLGFSDFLLKNVLYEEEEKANKAVGG